jgi:sugar lactone lactonase YvrE
MSVKVLHVSAAVRLLLYLALLAMSAASVACAADHEDRGVDEAADTSEKCRHLPPGPFKPESFGHPFNGSEDFAFDARGSMVAKRGNDVVRANGHGVVTSTIASLPGQTLGLRYHQNGNLIGAMVGANKIVSVAPNGAVTDLVTGLNGPNGIYVDRDRNVWFTEGGGNAVVRRSPDGKRKAFAAGADAQGANGVVVDSANARLFYTEFDKGKIHRVDLKGQQRSSEVATIHGAGLDGLVLDECGNLYVLDQRNSKLFRVRIGASGGAAAPPELLASFPVNVSNAQFGAGDGFDPNALYVVGNPGSVFIVRVGVGGSPVPEPGDH